MEHGDGSIGTSPCITLGTRPNLLPERQDPDQHLRPVCGRIIQGDLIPPVSHPFGPFFKVRKMKHGPLEGFFCIFKLKDNTFAAYKDILRNYSFSGQHFTRKNTAHVQAERLRVACIFRRTGVNPELVIPRGVFERLWNNRGKISSAKSISVFKTKRSLVLDRPEDCPEMLYVFRILKRIAVGKTVVQANSPVRKEGRNITELLIQLS